MLSLINMPLAGYHSIGRTQSKEDFGRKIQKTKGVVKVYPLLISRYYDYQGQKPEVKVDLELSEVDNSLRQDAS